MGNQLLTVRDGLAIKTNASSPTPSNAGDMVVDTSTGELKYSNGSTVAKVTTETNSLILTNKSMDASANTFTNIANSAISSSAGIVYSKLSLNNSIVNSDINSSAAINYSKLALTGSIVNADISSSASIAYSKLNLTNSIVNADIASSASIAYSKLNLAGSIVNADISNSASIAYSKLNLAGSVNLASDITGTLGLTHGGTGQTSKTAAFDGLSPNTTAGDFAVYNGTNNVRQPIGTDGQVLVSDSSQTNKLKWTTLQQGAKNYVTYNNFENNATTGWSLGNVSLTSNLPTGVPTFGSGASGNLSITTVSSGQLAGSYSLSLASSAATTAGDLLATQAYTIDIEDQAKVLAFRFYFEAQTGSANCNFSGTSSNSFGVAIYDVTNSAWIIPAGVFNLVQGSGVGFCTGTFQTPSNMTQFRLVLFNANATAGAATLYLDDFFVGPQITCMAPAMNDFSTRYSFTLDNSGVTTDNGTYSRRVGDSVEVVGDITVGTTTASIFAITFPGTISMDSSKLSSVSTPVGYAYNSLSATTSYPGTGDGPYPIFWDGSTTNKLFVAAQTTGNSLTKNNASTLFASGNRVYFKFTVPISGWSSNTSASSDTDTRLIAARYIDTSGTTYTAATPKTFVATTLDYDTSGSYSNNIFTVPVTGKYKVSIACNTGNVSWAAGSLQSAILRKNASTSQYISMLNTQAAATYRVALVGSGEIDCVAGDQLDVQLTFSVTNSLDTTAGRNWITFERLSGPAVVQASESVNARYFASATSISGSLATINWTTKDYDSHNQMSSGTYTVPVSGKYKIQAVLALSGTFALNSISTIEIQKNGSVISRVKNYAAAAVTQQPLEIGDEISCVSGDTLRIQVSSSATSPAIVSSNFENYISLFRTGN